MKNKFILLAAFFLLVSVLPIQTSAFWWFNQKKTIVVTPSAVQTLTDQEKITASAKYKNWEDSFEKRNIEEVIENKNNFIFTISEINYLFDVVSRTIKNPTLTNVGVTSSNGNINVVANFHKFISGRFSFVAKIISVDNKIRLQLSSVKFYGISVPVKWLAEPVNKELDKYFAFLYQDKRYQGFTVVIQDDLLQLKPEFSK